MNPRRRRPSSPPLSLCVGYSRPSSRLYDDAYALPVSTPQIQQCTTQPTLPLTQLGPPSDNHDDDDVILKQMILVALENAYPQYLLGTLTTFVSMKR